MPRQICPDCGSELDSDLTDPMPDSCPSCGKAILALDTGNRSTTAPLGEKGETTAFFFGSNVEVPTALEKKGPRLPKAFGRYEVERLLGEGAFGLVYRGIDPELRRPVAIKVPKRARIASESDVEAYMEEARILAGLDHPGIVAVYDLGRTQDRSCYVVSKLR